MLIEQYPVAINDLNDASKYRRFTSYFSLPLNYLVMKIIDSNICSEKSYKDIFSDVCGGFDYNFTSFASPGKFFKKLCSNPAMYLYKRPEIKELLQNLRKKGVRVFLE